MTQLEFRKRYLNSEVIEEVNKYTKEIVIRTEDETGTHDVRRETTFPERQILFNIIYGACLAYGYRNEDNGGSIEAICDTAEFTCHQFLPEANAYDSVYWPIRYITETV